MLTPLSMIRLVATLLAVAALSAAALAGPTSDTSRSAPGDARTMNDEPDRIDVDFEGGTLLALLQTLQTEHDVQLIFESNVELVSLPPIQLKGVRPIVVVQTVHALRPQVMFQQIDPAIVVRLDEARHRAISRPDGGRKVRPAPDAPAEDVGITVFDLDFRGGPSIAYVNEIRKANPQANIVVMPGAERAMVPAVQLRSVTTELALQLLDDIAVPVDVGGGGARVGLRVLESDHSAEPLCIVRYEEVRRSTGALSPQEEARRRHLAREAEELQKTHNHVWSVADALRANVTAEELLSAIEAGLEMLEDEGETTLRYHPDTKVLMLRGPMSSLEFVDSTIRAITKSATSP